MVSIFSVQYGADVNARLLEDDDKRTWIKKGMTPLHLAARLGRHNSMELLLACRADLNAKDRLGNTPIHMAVCCNLPCTVKEVKLLVSIQNQYLVFFDL